MEAKAVSIYINSLLPDHLRDYSRTYDRKSLGQLFSQLATEYPEEYPEILKKIADLGRSASFSMGETMTLEDLKPVIDKEAILNEMKKKLEKISQIPDPVRRKEERLKLYSTTTNFLHDKTLEAAKAKGTNLANTIISGARGNPVQLRTMITTPGLYTDYKGDVIDHFVEESFSEGLSPTSYLASTFGARQSVISTKSSTADAGFLGKQMGIAASDQLVTEEDSGSSQGIKILTDDYNDYRGRHLTKAVGPFPVGTIVDKDVLSYIKSNKVPHVYVRSPLTSNTINGIDAASVGILPIGEYPKIGTAVGNLATQSLSEPVTQMGLSCIAENELVQMADGSSKKIQDVQVGDYVLGADKQGNTFPTKVINTWDQGVQPVYEYTISDGTLKDVCKTTQCHKYLCKTPEGNQILEIKEIVEKDCELLCADSVVAKVTTVKFLGNIHCYDIEVEHEDSLFVLYTKLNIILSNSKHTSGAASGKEKMSIAGFNFINQFLQAPKAFPHKATVAEQLGMVERIKEAPQGGNYVYINGEEHYTLPGMQLLVKEGDEVEPGDALSDGLVDPKDVVRLRGLGEGRKYFVERLKQIYNDSGVPATRINLEILARAALNHVQLEDNTDYPDLYMDEPIRYNDFLAKFKPAADTKPLTPKKAVGMYLQAPVLHHTVGTRLTPRMVKEIEEAEEQQVYVSPTEPAFKPTTIRLNTVTDANADWLSRMNGWYLKKNLQRAAVRGEESNVLNNTHYAPRLAYGKDFGKNVFSEGKF